MPKPEGYRKALRLMQLAGEIRRARIHLRRYTGRVSRGGAEERGQSEAIGRNLYAMAGLKVPIIARSSAKGFPAGPSRCGGRQTLMLQYSTYSVISPEGWRPILWKKRRPRAPGRRRSASRQRA